MNPAAQAMADEIERGFEEYQVFDITENGEVKLGDTNAHQLTSLMKLASIAGVNDGKRHHYQIRKGDKVIYNLYKYGEE